MNLWSNILEYIFPEDPCMIEFEEKVFRDAFNAPRQHQLSWIISLYDYRDPLIKYVVRKLKNRRNIKLATTVGSMLYERVLEDLSDKRLFYNFYQPLLVPVPISRQRLRDRGFNQAGLLAHGLAKKSGWKVKQNIFIRKSGVQKQSLIRNRHARIKNIVGQLKIVRPHIVKNRNIIIVDDVTTTGATLNEMRRLLQAAGAKNVIAITLAH